MGTRSGTLLFGTGPGTKWDPATSLCVASAGAVQRAARQAPNIQTEGGDLIFGVRNGKRVGYQVGDSVVNFDDLQLKKEDDAGGKHWPTSVPLDALLE